MLNADSFIPFEVRPFVQFFHIFRNLPHSIIATSFAPDPPQSFPFVHILVLVSVVHEEIAGVQEVLPKEQLNLASELDRNVGLSYPSALELDVLVNCVEVAHDHRVLASEVDFVVVVPAPLVEVEAAERHVIAVEEEALHVQVLVPDLVDLDAVLDQVGHVVRVDQVAVHRDVPLASRYDLHFHPSLHGLAQALLHLLHRPVVRTDYLYRLL